jgi:hypothetical protein
MTKVKRPYSIRLKMRRDSTLPLRGWFPTKNTQAKIDDLSEEIADLLDHRSEGLWATINHLCFMGMTLDRCARFVGRGDTARAHLFARINANVTDHNRVFPYRFRQVFETSVSNEHLDDAFFLALLLAPEMATNFYHDELESIAIAVEVYSVTNIWKMLQAGLDMVLIARCAIDDIDVDLMLSLTS